MRSPTGTPPLGRRVGSVTAITGCAAWVDLKLLLFVKGLSDRVEVAVEAAHDVSSALSFGGAALVVVAGSGVVGHADEHDAPERFVGLADR